MRELARLDWRKHLIVASVLVHVAKTDRDTSNRVEAIRCLAAGKMSHPEVLTAVAVLMTDSDPSVREEADSRRWSN